MNQIPEKSTEGLSSSGAIPTPRPAVSEGGWKTGPGLGYVLAVVLPPLALLIRLAFPLRIEDPPVVHFFLIPIALASYFGRLGAGLTATILSAALADYFLLAPDHSLSIEKSIHLVVWGLLIICGLLINGLTELMHRARRRAEQTGELLTATLENIGDAVIATDPEGRITFLNTEAERITGWSNEMARGCPLPSVFRIIEEATRQPVLDPTRRVLETGGVAAPANRNLLIGRDGRETPIEESAAPIRQDDGGIRGIVLTFRDCTERHRREEALREAGQAQLQQVQEALKKRTTELDAVNKELESFSYSISHDLRAPVRAMDGFAEALREDCAEILPAEGMRYVEVIRASAKRMGALIDDLLAFSKLGRLSVSRGHVDIAQLVQEIVEGCDDQESGKVEIRVGELPACRGDRALLKQVWTNLLSNALKYSSNRPQTLVEIGARADSRETVYFVRDNGVGFDMRYAGKLFGVFQRLHHEREFPGTGVGLAIVHRIVTRHGGRIWAEAGVDQGATFFFTLEPETPPAS